MTEQEILKRVTALLAPAAGRVFLVRRNGHTFLGLPGGGAGAAMSLGLYQPQRIAGRLMSGGLRLLAATGAHRFLPSFRNNSGSPVEALNPPFPGIDRPTAGFLMGSPEHRIPRVIASYRLPGGWEVCKIAFGEEGMALLEREARVLDVLSGDHASVPRCAGFHKGDDFALLRTPYLTGDRLPPGDHRPALALLESWTTSLPARPMKEFPEWEHIHRQLSAGKSGEEWIARISDRKAVPAVSHGDFARWNLLKQPDGKLMALDWEWGQEEGLPGIDLVHYFLQDNRLVRRLPDREAITVTIKSLEAPSCRAYLGKTGWKGDPLDVIVTSLAYKQGAGHQQNESILEAALDFRNH